MIHIANFKEEAMHRMEMNSSAINLPLGPQAGFIFHLDQLYFIEIQDEFFSLTGTQAMEWHNKSVFYLIDKLAYPAHLRATHSLFRNGMDALKKAKVRDISFNLEFNIADEKLGSKRFLLQFSKISDSLQEDNPAARGRLTDIHHMYNGGMPSLTIIQNNSIEKRIIAEIQDDKNASPIDLTARELEVIKLKSKGFSTREIAVALNRSTLTIYSVVRDVKNKTGMELIPLVKSLHEKGLLD